MTYFIAAVRLIDKFSANEARLDSKSPVSKPLLVVVCVLFFWVGVGELLLLVWEPVRDVGCKTPPNGSKLESVKYLWVTIRNFSRFLYLEDMHVWIKPINHAFHLRNSWTVSLILFLQKIWSIFNMHIKHKIHIHQINNGIKRKTNTVNSWKITCFAWLIYNVWNFYQNGGIKVKERIFKNQGSLNRLLLSLKLRRRRPCWGNFLLDFGFKEPQNGMDRFYFTWRVWVHIDQCRNGIIDKERIETFWLRIEAFGCLQQ